MTYKVYIHIYIVHIYIYMYIYIYICRTCILMQDMFKNNLQQFIVCRNHFSEIWKYNRFEIMTLNGFRYIVSLK